MAGPNPFEDPGDPGTAGHGTGGRGGAGHGRGRASGGPAARTLRRVRRVVIVFFLLYTVAVTWPGAVPFNRIRPLVLGLPFSLFWPALWIVAGCLLLFVLEWAWERAEAERPGSGPE